MVIELLEVEVLEVPDEVPEVPTIAEVELAAAPDDDAPVAVAEMAPDDAPVAVAEMVPDEDEVTAPEEALCRV